MNHFIRIILKLLKILIFLPMIVIIFSGSLDFDTFEKDIKSLLSDDI